MKSALLDAVELNPPGTPRATIIWLHGLGADGNDFVPLIPQLGIVREYGVRVVLPHAPHRAVTINGGMIMPAWYDIASTDFLRHEDLAGIEQSRRQLEALIEREISNGIEPERIVLAGFSQGGAIVLHAGLRYGAALGGILALSTYLPVPERLAGEASAASQAVPIMQAHGLTDPVVPLRLAQLTRETLLAAGYQLSWHTYPMQHSVIADEVLDIRRWLHALPALSATAQD